MNVEKRIVYQKDYHYTNGLTTPCKPTKASIRSGPITIQPPTRSGVSLPGYRHLIERGENATTPYYVSGTTYTVPYGVISVKPHTSVGCGPGGKFVERFFDASGYYLNSWGNLTPLDIAAALEDAGTDAASQLASKVRSTLSFDGGTTLGELRETLQMLTNPMRTIVRSHGSYVNKINKYLRKLGHKKLAVKQIKNIEVDIGSMYLSHVYGIKPLIKDVEDLHSRLTKDQPPIIRVAVRGYADVTQALTTTTSDIIMGIACSVLYADTKVARVVVTRKVGVRPYTFQGSAAPLADYGLALDNFVPTIWNLLPYSFVVDYFTNIGSIYDAMSIPSAAIAWGSISNRVSRIYTRQTRILGPQSGSSATSGSFGNAEVRFESYERSPNMSVEIPHIDFRLPSFQQAVNVGALLEQRLTTRRLVTNALY